MPDYCPACYCRKVYCHKCKGYHCGCSWNQCPKLDKPRSARRILKHAALHILRSTDLWFADPRSWTEAQEILRALQMELKSITGGHTVKLVTTVLLLACLACGGGPIPTASAAPPKKNTNTVTSVTIGKLIYVGGSVNQFGDISVFRVALNTTGITAQPLTIGDLEMIVASCPDVKGPCIAASQDLGGQGPTTSTTTWDFYGGTDGTGLVYTLPNCNDHGCVCIDVQLVSATGQSFTFALANGQSFTAPAITTVSLTPLPGQAFIQVGQSADIVLQKQ